ncbi:hypothetical protein [Streptomyces sp. NPDC015131]|uniref:COG1470 family protein n=1 Tax=Streptomyces sp. NPDC015131 TaxID=3364941 RepID=UPI0036FB46A9
MGAIVLLLEDDAPAVPGEETRRTAQICNSGSVVDRFELDVLGDAKEWIRVEPAGINVFPDQSAGVELVFTPPRSPSVPAGEVPFALRVMCQEDIEGSVVEEAAVTVGPYTDFGVGLTPRTRRTRLGTRFHAVVDNRGNAPLKAELYAAQADAALTFRFAHPGVEVPPGKGAVVPVRVRPAARRWRGAATTLAFQVVVVRRSGDGEEEERTADGAVVQAPVVSAAAAKFVAAVAAAVAALAALWLFVLRPDAGSEAREQPPGAAGGPPAGSPGGGAPPPPPPPGTAPGPGPSPSGAAAGGPGPGGAGPGGAGPGGAGAPVPGVPVPPPAGGGTGTPPPAGAGGGTGGANAGGDGDADGGRPVDFRIDTDAAPSAGFDSTAVYEVPKDATLLVSDVVYENVAGDTGVVRLQRGGSVLRRLALDTYRNHDEHFTEPLEFGPGEQVVLAVHCAKPAGQTGDTGAGTCTPGAYFSGRLVAGH